MPVGRPARDADSVECVMRKEKKEEGRRKKDVRVKEKWFCLDDAQLNPSCLSFIISFEERKDSSRVTDAAMEVL